MLQVRAKVSAGETCTRVAAAPDIWSADCAITTVGSFCGGAATASRLNSEQQATTTDVSAQKRSFMFRPKFCYETGNLVDFSTADHGTRVGIFPIGRSRRRRHGDDQWAKSAMRARRRLSGSAPKRRLYIGQPVFASSRQTCDLRTGLVEGAPSPAGWTRPACRRFRRRQRSKSIREMNPSRDFPVGL